MTKPYILIRKKFRLVAGSVPVDSRARISLAMVIKQPTSFRAYLGSSGQILLVPIRRRGTPSSRRLSPQQLAKFAEQMVKAKSMCAKDALREKIVRGFYGCSRGGGPTLRVETIRPSQRALKLMQQLGRVLDRLR